MRVRDFLESLHGTKPTLGTWARDGHTEIRRILGAGGLDVDHTDGHDGSRVSSIRGVSICSLALQVGTSPKHRAKPLQACYYKPHFEAAPQGCFVPVPFKYRAFLSYAHADTRWAKWLHGKLEGFPIDKDLVGRATDMGPVPKTVRPIFRDRDDFSGGHTPH
jgi:hypothetical protein